MNISMEDRVSFLEDWLREMNLSDTTANLIANSTGLLLILGIGLFGFLIARYINVRFISRIVRKSKGKWDDILFETKVFNRMALLIPGLIYYIFSPVVIGMYPLTFMISMIVVKVYLVVVSVLTINAFFTAIYKIYDELELAEAKPIKGYVQIGRFILYTIGGVIVITSLVGQPVGQWLAGIGAFSAILLLVFKDPLQGFVGGIQINTNDLLRIGDWITMPKFDVDGVVTDISLVIVKVRNFDNTISSIPTYAFISESFKNWRGMQESGGRRIKRAVYIDVNSVQPVNAEIKKTLLSNKLVLANLASTLSEIDDEGLHIIPDTSYSEIYTNLTLFRDYMYKYLKNHPGINFEMGLMIRALPVTEYGIPVEVYAFSRVKVWEGYEEAWAHILDQILVVLPLFNLRLFQRPSGMDIH